MGVLLQVAYRRGVGVSVPSPADKTTPDIDWWYDHIAKQMNSFAKAGVTAILLPPVSKAEGSDGVGCDGYGVDDVYDIGSKNQQGSIPTRFGTREQLLRLCAIAKANGVDVYVDWVPHQRMGQSNSTYTFLGADGKTKNGRFPLDKSCFCLYDAKGKVVEGYVARDPIAGPISDDFSFGDELCPINALPKGYVQQGLVDAGDWLTQTLDLNGYRIDDTKGQAIQAVKTFINSKSMKGKFSFGEYDDGNPGNLYYWLQQMNWECSCLDFALHYTLESMCNSTSQFDMTQLDHAGLQGIAPLNAVTFVENPDTDTDGFAGIVYNKILAYAYILTSEGYPQIYYRDYSTDTSCYGLQPWIDNLMWIHENFASGSTIFRHKEYQFVVYERLSERGLVVGLNNDISSTWKTVTVQTSKPNTHWHDYSGNNPVDCWSDSNGMLTFGIPPNDNGHGYVCWSTAGYNSAIKPEHNSITQLFYGAADLDIGPLDLTFKNISRIYCAANTNINLTHDDTTLRFNLYDANGVSIPVVKGNAKTMATGWYTIQGHGSSATPSPFTLSVTYTAPQTL